MDIEKSLVLIKPDAVKKKFIGRIIQMYEENGLIIEDMYMTEANLEVLEKHYEEHSERDFFKPLLSFMTSGPICALLVSGSNAVKVIREINGATNPAKARPGTIRYLFGTTVQKNAVHGSANIEDAKKELKIWFNLE
ncbi:nucleoside-diphosphate kinase [Clostridiaceae bacterium HSG29]|nr:nucleoside-diphosphate kinase [Clostridiaceae bacterium HSG29]